VFGPRVKIAPGMVHGRAIKLGERLE